LSNGGWILRNAALLQATNEIKIIKLNAVVGRFYYLGWYINIRWHFGTTRSLITRIPFLVLFGVQNIAVLISNHRVYPERVVQRTFSGCVSVHGDHRRGGFREAKAHTD